MCIAAECCRAQRTNSGNEITLNHALKQKKTEKARLFSASIVVKLLRNNTAAASCSFYDNLRTWIMFQLFHGRTDNIRYTIHPFPFLAECQSYSKLLLNICQTNPSRVFPSCFSQIRWRIRKIAFSRLPSVNFTHYKVNVRVFLSQTNTGGGWKKEKRRFFLARSLPSAHQAPLKFIRIRDITQLWAYFLAG